MKIDELSEAKEILKKVEGKCASRASESIFRSRRELVTSCCRIGVMVGLLKGSNLCLASREKAVASNYRATVY